MDVVSLDRKGRVTIPKPQREALGLAEEDELTLTLEGGELRLRPVARKQLKVRARRKWGREAFLKSGEATFADEE
jgi:AbrB family looped-hinge helix DNA binding protein